MAYLIIFFISVWILWLAERQYKNNKFKQGNLLLIISAIIPCVMAALRAESVGIDVTWYVVPNFNLAKEMNSFKNYLSIESIEPLYAILVYISSKLFNNVSGLLFFIQILVVAPVYLVLYKSRKNFQMWMGGLIFYLIIYNYSYSLIRQCIAGAFIFLSFVYYYDNKKFQGILFSIIAVGFHTSAIVLVIIIFIISNIDMIRRSNILKTLILVLAIIIIVNAKRILIFLSALNIIDDKYLFRVNAYSTTFNYFKFVIFGIFAVKAIYMLNKYSKERISLIYIFPLLELIIMSGSVFISQYFGRLEYYFYFFYILTLSRKKTPFKIKEINSILFFNIVNIIINLIFWIKMFLINNSFETIPYIFRSL